MKNTMGFFLTLALVFSLTFISAESFGYNYLEEGENLNSAMNYSTVNVNNSQYLQGYTPTTLNSLYCALTGCSMTGNLINTKNITASYFLGDGSQLTGIESGSTFDESSFTAESILFSNGSNIVENNSELYWDISEGRLRFNKIDDAGNDKIAVYTPEFEINNGFLRANVANSVTAFRVSRAGVTFFQMVPQNYAGGMGLHWGARDESYASGSNTIITRDDNVEKNHDHPQSSNPTFFFHSNTNPDTDNTQWGSITHDSNNFVLNTGTGYVEVQANNGSNISLYVATNVSATGFITRTSIFDKSENAFDYIKDADYYKDSKTDEIDHSKFYGYVGEFEVTDYDNPIINHTEGWVNDYEIGWIYQNSTIVTYGKKMEEGVELGMEIDVLRQAVYELNERVKSLEESCVVK